MQLNTENGLPTGRSRLRWKRLSSTSYDLLLLNPEELNGKKVQELLDLIQNHKHRGLTLRGSGRRALARWSQNPRNPLASEAYVLLSNWFLTGGGDRGSDVANCCEALWDELFACRPQQRLSSPESSKNHIMIPACFDSFYNDLIQTQGQQVADSANETRVRFEESPIMVDGYEEYLALAEQIHQSPRFCWELVDLITKKKQLILEGPPGSGKTFVGEHLARFLAYGKGGYASWIEGADGRAKKVNQHFEVVQFHESYGYEDFVQGFRPEVELSGNMVFKRRDGIFLDFCEKARSNTGYFVILIDEINRGKPSKIFGELLFLLEYRGKEVKLSSGKAFSIPENVLIIGTMNTADKSIALVDYALRRRFLFVPLRPVTNGDAPVLRLWLERKKIQNREEILSLFLRLNQSIETDFGHDLQVGHSYFMDQTLGNGSSITEEKLKLIWKYSILPLIQEYAYTKKAAEIEDKYGLDAIRKRGDVI